MNKTRREFLLKSLTGALGLSVWRDRLSVPSFAQSNHDGIDQPSVHGMALIGEKSLFLSHLPLFSSVERRSPHNYQVLLEAAFANAKDQTQYIADRRKSKAKLYTVEPEKFVLTDLITTDPERTRLSSFKATIYRDHFERGGKPIINDAMMTIKNVIHFRAFDLSEARPSKMEYILFGKGGETFLAHKITKPPDFDHLLSVKASGVLLTDAILKQGLRVNVSTLADAIDSRLKEKQGIVCDIEFSSGDEPKKAQARVTVLKEFYFETGDLDS